MPSAPGREDAVGGRRGARRRRGREGHRRSSTSWATGSRCRRSPCRRSRCRRSGSARAPARGPRAHRRCRPGWSPPRAWTRAAALPSASRSRPRRTASVKSGSAVHAVEGPGTRPSARWTSELDRIVVTVTADRCGRPVARRRPGSARGRHEVGTAGPDGGQLPPRVEVAHDDLGEGRGRPRPHRVGREPHLGGAADALDDVGARARRVLREVGRSPRHRGRWCRRAP